MRQVFQTLPWVHPAESPALLAFYRRHGRRRRLPKGATLKSSADDPRLFLLDEGLCAYVMKDGDDRPVVLSVIVPGRTMGDITCISGRTVNICSRTLRPSTVLEVPPRLLVELMRTDAELALQVTRGIIAKQECHLEGMLANFTLTPADRLRVLLKVLLVHPGGGEPGPGFHPVLPALNNQEYAAIVHATRVTVSRTFSLWVRQGLMRKRGTAIEVDTALFAGLDDWVATG